MDSERLTPFMLFYCETKPSVQAANPQVSHATLLLSFYY